jgi:non-ribosomal peptide synthetase component F
VLPISVLIAARGKDSGERRFGIRNCDFKLNGVQQDRPTNLRDFNRTEKAYPATTTIMDHFLEQAAKTPDNTAVVFKDTRRSYLELREQANRIGNFLWKRGGTYFGKVNPMTVCMSSLTAMSKYPGIHRPVGSVHWV